MVEESICKCINKPNKGAFEVGNNYEYIITMKGASIIDDNEKRWPFTDMELRTHFKEVK